MKIGIVGGAGWIGRTLLIGLIRGSVIEPASLLISGSKSTAPDLPDGVRYTTDNAYLVAQSDVVILSVRPGQLGTIAIDASRCLLLSVMAGVSLHRLERICNARRAVRAMPNAAAEVRLSYTPYTVGPAATLSDRVWTRQILNCIGVAAEFSDESLIDYMTGLTGSGPAFVALFAQAMIDHAVNRGISRDLATAAVQQLIAGAGCLIGRATQTPSEVVQEFTEYQGTTAAGLNAMRAAGLPDTVHAGLRAAEARARSIFHADNT
jgi:pyrroline-5-carboxylate reductase